MKEQDQPAPYEHESKKQFEQFGGVTELDLTIRLPTSYYEAIEEYCKIADMSTREFLNYEIINAISNLQIGDLKTEFVRKYHLGELSAMDRETMIQATHGSKEV